MELPHDRSRAAARGDMVSQGELVSGSALKSWAQGKWWKDLRVTAETFQNTAGFNKVKSIFGDIYSTQVTLKVSKGDETFEIAADYLAKKDGVFYIIDTKYTTLDNFDLAKSFTPNQSKVFSWMKNGDDITIEIRAADSKLRQLNLFPVEGIDLDGFSVTYLTNAERKVVEAIRLRLIKSFDETTVFEKPISKDIMDQYLDGTYKYGNSVGGCISRAQDVKQLNTSEKAFHGLRLDFKDTKFTTSTSDYFIRFTTSESPKISLPTAKTYPNTGHGFTSSSYGNLGVPELEVTGGGVKFSDAAIYRRLENGGVEMIAVFNPNTEKFSKLK